MFKVAIIGGEGTNDYEFFAQKCIYFLQNKAKEGRIIICTTGDAFVEKFSKQYRISTEQYIANWRKYGRDALKARNEEMLSSCEAVISFNDGLKDTQMITKKAIEKGLPCRKVK